MRRLLFALVLLTGLCCGELRAQSTNASVTGYVTDPTKAVIVGAKVIVINVATNIRYEATTNSAGSYDVMNLAPGPYRIEVEKPGFKTVVKSDVILHVQDTAAINFEMALGSASEIVTVTAGGLVVNTTDATVSTVVDRQFAENLPINGRSFQTLIELTPGVVLTTSTQADSGQFSVNGQRAASNYWMVDGVSANVGVGSAGTPGNGLSGSVGSFSVLGGTNSLVSVDALQEFRIQTSTFAPEFGRTPGGQISIVTRSGTNQFHGSLFDYLRNDVLDANNWFNTSVAPPLPKAEERQNDFGGTSAGPILKDKTFFFFSYEGLRLRLPQTLLTRVPDMLSRQNAAPSIQPFLTAYPLPNGPDNVATGVAQFNASSSDPATLNASSLRIDHRFGEKVNAFGRYNYSPSDLTQRGPANSPLSVLTRTEITTQTGTFGVTWTMTPRAADEFRFNYSHVSNERNSRQDNFAGAVPLTSLPFPSPYTSQNGFFAFGVFSLSPQFSINIGKGERSVQRQINVVDNATLQRGSHNFKFGADFRRLSPINEPASYIQEAFASSVPSAEAGRVSFAVVISGSRTTFLFHNFGAFAQDTWRVLPRLTLTYGLRWDLDFAPSSISGPGFASVTGVNLKDLSALALAPSGTSAFQNTYGNVAPRLGIAYQASATPDWGTVVRGGFGAFYDLATSEAGNLAISGVYPFGAQARFFATSFPLSAAMTAPPTVTPPSASKPGVVFAFDPNLELPYTLEWNVALEQSLGGQQSLSASYIGAAGRRLIQTATVLAPNPAFTEADLVTNVATSAYNALQVQFQRRLSHGLQALGSYTWSHSIDSASAGSTGVGSNQPLGTDLNANRGPSDFDIRHAFSAALTYEVPFPKKNPFADAILRGWSVQNIVQVRSAPPVEVSDGNFGQLNNGFQADVRPDLVPGQPFYLHGPQYPGGKAFNVNAFQDPPVDPTTGNPLRQGNVPRNFLRGFGATQWDFAVHRDFPIRESIKLQFRAEMFNVLNHPNFGQPIGDITSAQFGVSTRLLGQSLSAGNGSTGSSSGTGGFSPLYQIGGPRSIQLALKLSF